ncbi:MAG TPA: 50S ribosomal protein L32 [Patescibacteria group bacterium]|nr:50S ribosomal protein L32 [Patescibacteria group bacterium]
MGLPSKRRTTTSKKQRAAHFALKTKAVAKCGDCGAPSLPHHACSKCGRYRGRRAVDTQKRVLRATRASKKKK